MKERKLTKTMMQDFFDNELTCENLKNVPFDDMTALFNDKTKTGIMENVVLRVFYLTDNVACKKFSRDFRKSNANLNIRVFYAAYMIAYKTNNVFEQVGDLETKLFGLATEMLSIFEQTCFALHGEGLKVFANAYTFPRAMRDYILVFRKWKISDEQKLSMRVKHALFALYKTEKDLTCDGMEQKKRTRDFEIQRDRLRFKLKQICGVNGLGKFDKETGKNLPIPTEEALVNNTTAAMRYPNRLSNEALAYELMIDPSFKLDDKGGNPSEDPMLSRIRESFHDAFWASLVGDLTLQVFHFF